MPPGCLTRPGCLIGLSRMSMIRMTWRLSMWQMLWRGYQSGVQDVGAVWRKGRTFCLCGARQCRGRSEEGGPCGRSQESRPYSHEGTSAAYWIYTRWVYADWHEKPFSGVFSSYSHRFQRDLCERRSAWASACSGSGRFDRLYWCCRNRSDKGLMNTFG